MSDGRDICHLGLKPLSITLSSRNDKAHLKAQCNQRQEQSRGNTKDNPNVDNYNVAHWKVGWLLFGQESKQIRRREWRRKGPPGGSRRHAKTLYVDYMLINLGAQQLYWESDCQCRYPWEIAAESYRAPKRAKNAQCYIMYLYQVYRRL